jgi:glycosyltransferase involved in cell wall biosynthesis
MRAPSDQRGVGLTGADGRRAAKRAERVVLFDTRKRHFTQNPYIALLCDSVTPEVEVHGFAWYRALVGRYDVVHAHWPEYLLRPGRRGLRPFAYALTAAWMLRLWLLHVPVVRTIHDRAPLVPVSAVERLLIQAWDRLTVGRIWLTPPPERGASSVDVGDVIIPHGDYRPWIARLDGSACQTRGGAAVRAARGTEAIERPPGEDSVRMLCFGILRPYKRFEEVIRAVAVGNDSSIELVVAGSAPDPEYLSRLVAECGRSERISVLPRRTTDSELLQLLGDSRLVVVPYADIYNSGVVLFALSAGCPVAIRANQTATALQEEYGPDWVMLWDGELDAAKLQDIVQHLNAPRRDLAHPERREWKYVGRQHASFYAETDRDARLRRTARRLGGEHGRLARRRTATVDVVHWNPRRNLLESRQRLPVRGRVNNFGDLIGPLVVERILAAHEIDASCTTSHPRRLVSVGSILHLAHDGDVVWGAGVNGSVTPSEHQFTALDVRAVRGPLTRKFLLARGIKAPEVYGDPGLLVPLLVPELQAWAKTKHREVLVVPNFRDLESSRAQAGPNCLDPRGGLMRALRAIAGSEVIVASSLHAIVIAEALGIPVVRVASSAESEFKYRDYYLGTGREPVEAAPTFADAFAELPQSGSLVVPEAALMSAFPIDLWLDADDRRVVEER